MKIARATDADIEMALELAQALDDLAERYVPSAIASPIDERLEFDDRRQLVRVCEYLTGLADKGSLFRLAIGMSAVLDPKNNITDPNAELEDLRGQIADLRERMKAQAHAADIQANAILIDMRAIVARLEKRND